MMERKQRMSKGYYFISEEARERIRKGSLTKFNLEELHVFLDNHCSETTIIGEEKE